MFDLTIDRESPIPYYYQIREWIRGLIASGQLQPGDKLPSETDLSKQLGVSRLTVRQALKDLMNEDLLVRQRAKGTFVTHPRQEIPFTRDRLRGMTEEMTAEGLTLYSHVEAQELVPATGEIMRELKIDLNDQVIRICRLRSTDQGPVVLETCYHPYQRFRELLTMDLTDRSIYEILDKEYDALPQEALDSVVAGVATADEARLLDIDKGDPVMRYKRTAVDKNGLPMEFTRSVYRADRYQFVIRYRRSVPKE